MSYFSEVCEYTSYATGTCSENFATIEVTCGTTTSGTTPIIQSCQSGYNAAKSGQSSSDARKEICGTSDCCLNGWDDKISPKCVDLFPVSGPNADFLKGKNAKRGFDGYS